MRVKNLLTNLLLPLITFQLFASLICVNNADAAPLTLIFKGSKCQFTVANADTPKLDSVDSPTYSATCVQSGSKPQFSCTFITPGTSSVTKKMRLLDPWGSDGMSVLLSEDGKEELRFQPPARTMNFISQSRLDTIMNGRIIGIKQCIGHMEVN